MPSLDDDYGLEDANNKGVGDYGIQNNNLEGVWVEV